MSYMRKTISSRLGGAGFDSSADLYKFARIKRAKAEAAAANPGVRLIDMGVGEPDRPADPEIVRVLAQEAGKPENRWYSDNGIIEFQEAARDYLSNTGWRMAFLAGNSVAVKAFGTVKDNTDSGQFRAIQKAGAYALRHPEITAPTCEKYSRRMGILVAALRELGFDARKPGGTFYCYVPAPKGAAGGRTRFNTAAEASDYLIRQALVSTVPWDDTGANLRFSVTFEAEDFDDEICVISEMKKRLKRLELVFD